MDRTFGDIICDNANFISGVLENVFLINSPAKTCDQRNSMDIKSFQVFRVYGKCVLKSASAVQVRFITVKCFVYDVIFRRKGRHN